MKKTLSRIVALGGAAAVALGVAGVTPAQAAYSDCPSNKVCVWRDASYGVLLGYRSPGGGLDNISSGNDNRMSSYGNRTGTNGAWYWGKNGTGTCFTMKAGYSNSYVGSANNDKMSSWRTNRGC